MISVLEGYLLVENNYLGVLMAIVLKGLPFPVSKNPLGFFYTQLGPRNIKSDLIQLILTNPGDRVMLSQFGTPLRKFFYEPNNEVTRSAITEAITNAIATWEPRITVKSIVVANLSESDKGEGTYTNQNGVLVKINYINPEQINVVENLILAIPFEGG
jgi:phage baseplate assembly protein W